MIILSCTTHRCWRLGIGEDKWEFCARAAALYSHIVSCMAAAHYNNALSSSNSSNISSSSSSSSSYTCAATPVFPNGISRTQCPDMLVQFFWTKTRTSAGPHFRTAHCRELETATAKCCSPAGWSMRWKHRESFSYCAHLPPHACWLPSTLLQTIMVRS
jgi:hypothetical protein